MFGFGRGWRMGGRGMGWGFWAGPWNVPATFKAPEGYTYIGPCRWGFGPNAFYREDKTGRIVHAWELFGFRPWWLSGGWSNEDELNYLRREKETLEERIRELERKLKGE